MFLSWQGQFEERHPFLGFEPVNDHRVTLLSGSGKDLLNEGDTKRYSRLSKKNPLAKRKSIQAPGFEDVKKS